LTPAHHSFARKAIHALNRAIAVIGKILLSDTLYFWLRYWTCKITGRSLQVP
jgi:hypothetical protein